MRDLGDGPRGVVVFALPIAFNIRLGNDRDHHRPATRQPLPASHISLAS